MGSRAEIGQSAVERVPDCDTEMLRSCEDFETKGIVFLYSTFVERGRSSSME